MLGGIPGQFTDWRMTFLTLYVYKYTKMRLEMVLVISSYRYIDMKSWVFI